jgi:hypothetical protein
VDKFKFQRVPIEVFRSFKEADDADRQYWWSRTDDEHLEYMQYLRELNYGDAARGPMVKVLEYVRIEPKKPKTQE